MHSDEPDEDADNLDDNNLLTNYLDGRSPGPASDAASAVLDWPPLTKGDLGLNVDAETLRWFETNHADWRQGMRSVLRAWVDMRIHPAADTTSG
jgi:hypothetical protein